MRIHDSAVCRITSTVAIVSFVATCVLVGDLAGQAPKLRPDLKIPKINQLPVLAGRLPAAMGDAADDLISCPIDIPDNSPAKFGGASSNSRARTPVGIQGSKLSTSLPESMQRPSVVVRGGGSREAAKIGRLNQYSQTMALPTPLSTALPTNQSRMRTVEPFRLGAATGVDRNSVSGVSMNALTPSTRLRPPFGQAEVQAQRQAKRERLVQAADSLANGNPAEQYQGGVNQVPNLDVDDEQQVTPSVPRPVLSTALPNSITANRMSLGPSTGRTSLASPSGPTRSSPRRVTGIPSSPKIMTYPVRRSRGLSMGARGGGGGGG